MSKEIFDNTTVDKLPPNLRALIEPNINTNEKIYLCCLVTEEGFVLMGGKHPPQAVVITNSKLLVTNINSFFGSGGAGFAISYPQSEPFRNNLIIIEYTRIRSIKAEPRGKIIIDYGLSKIVGDNQAKIQADPMIISFPPDWVENIIKFINAARNIPTNQTGQVSNLDIADQLAKLAELHTKGLLTDAEFSEAKRKILGN